jgi:hypothetical protein
LHRRFDRRFYFSTVGSSNATLKRGFYLSYSSVASLFLSNPNSCRPPAAPDAALVLVSGDLPASCAPRASSTGPSVPAAGRRASPPRQIARAARRRTHLGFHYHLQFRPFAATSARRRLSRGAQEAFLHPQQLVTIQSRCGEDFSNFHSFHCTARAPLHYSCLVKVYLNLFAHVCAELRPFASDSLQLSMFWKLVLWINHSYPHKYTS